jgi:LPPG:FO 2-phospho-L-lactate transferase
MSDTGNARRHRVVALSGGVGGARLVDGLARTLDARQLTVIVNTADDFRRYGLHISPDVDTVLYTLSERADPVTGWGIAGDTHLVLDAVTALGEDPWFRLGDRDLATHLVRTAWLDEGASLTDVTVRLAARAGVRPVVLPMSDDPVATIIVTREGELPMQEWFVRRRCLPPAEAIRYAGADAARPTDRVIEAIRGADVVIVGPSNPYLSIGPILALSGIRETLRRGTATIVAVSPLVGGRAIKGPAAEMLTQLTGEATSGAVARLYADFLDGIVIDRADAADAPAISALGIEACVTDTLMRDRADRARLAAETLAFAASLRGSPHATDG